MILFIAAPLVNAVRISFFKWNGYSQNMRWYGLKNFVNLFTDNLFWRRAVSALSVALYGMFLAIIIPPARKDKIVAALVAISFALSFACTYLPGISALSDGTRTIILTVAISCAGALLFPVKTQSEEAEQ